MPRCAGSKPDGSPCERIVPGSQSHCYSHDPERSDERRRNASRAGKSRPNKEIQDIKQSLSSLADGVLNGTVDKGRGAVVSQVYNVLLRAVTVELKLKEQLELEARLEELAAALERQQQKGGGYSFTG